MQRAFTTRLDDDLLERLDQAARALGVSKRRLVEEALRARLGPLGNLGAGDVLERTCGAWRRDEASDETVRRCRESFRRGLVRAGPP